MRRFTLGGREWQQRDGQAQHQATGGMHGWAGLPVTLLLLAYLGGPTSPEAVGAEQA